MEMLMTTWIRQHGMWAVLQCFKRALVTVMGETEEGDAKSKMLGLVNFLGQKV